MRSTIAGCLTNPGSNDWRLNWSRERSPDRTTPFNTTPLPCCNAANTSSADTASACRSSSLQVPVNSRTITRGSVPSSTRHTPQDMADTTTQMTTRRRLTDHMDLGRPVKLRAYNALERSFLRKQESSVFLLPNEKKEKTLDSRLKMSGMTERGEGGIGEMAFVGTPPRGCPSGETSRFMRDGTGAVPYGFGSFRVR